MSLLKCPQNQRCLEQVQSTTYPSPMPGDAEDVRLALLQHRNFRVYYRPAANPMLRGAVLFLWQSIVI